MPQAIEDHKYTQEECNWSDYSVAVKDQWGQGKEQQYPDNEARNPHGETESGQR